jgi:endoplasmic reticulum protein 29
MEKALLVFAALVAVSMASPPLLGVMQLDSLTFNKTVSKFKHVFVKFDEFYPKGQKHGVFGDLARDLSEMDDILLAEVRIRDQGDRMNEDLAKRFRITKQDYPELILFSSKGGPKPELTRYGGDITGGDLLSFLRGKTGLSIVLPGCLKEYDDWASMFARNAGGKDREKILREVEALVAGIGEEDEEQLGKAQKYLKIMKLAFSDGMDTIHKEEERVKKLLKEKMSSEKKDDLTKTLNILKSFQPNLHKDRDEL